MPKLKQGHREKRQPRFRKAPIRIRRGRLGELTRMDLALAIENDLAGGKLVYESARAAGVHVQTVYNWRKLGLIPDHVFPGSSRGRTRPLGLDAAAIRKMVDEEGLSLELIGERVGACCTTVGRAYNKEVEMAKMGTNVKGSGKGKVAPEKSYSAHEPLIGLREWRLDNGM